MATLASRSAVVTTMALVTAVTFTACRRSPAQEPAARAGTPPAAAVATGDAGSVAPAAAVDDKTLADAAAAIARAAAVPDPSPDAIADQIGKSPEAMFAYIHDHVRTEIYSGVLRGARNTLRGGAGNAWDQALLLAAMLRHHGREVRFTRVHLTPAAAAPIVDRMFADAARPRPAAAAPVAVPDSMKDQTRAVLASLQADWRRAQADLLEAIDRAHLPLGDSAASEQALQSEAADHLYVEYHEGDRWIPLDPVAAAAPGTAAGSDGQSFAEIPDASYHHVTIHVMVEERRDGKLERKEALRYKTTAAALSGERVLVSHKLDHDMTGLWRATPLLQVGGHYYAARTFSSAGLLAVKGGSKEDLIGQAHQSVGRLGRVTDAFGGGDAKATPPVAAPELTAESLDVEFTDPADHTVAVRRELFDRIGIVARANKTAATAPLSAITVVNDIPLPFAGMYACAFASGPLDQAAPFRRVPPADRLLSDLAALGRSQPGPNGALSADDSQRLGRVLQTLPAMLQASAESTVLVSQRLAQQLRAGDAPVLFYEATPRLVIASFGPATGAAIDLRRNSVRAVARNASGADVVRATLARSVVDAAVESALLASSARPGASASRVAGIDIFGRARAEGIRLVAARAGTPLTAVHAPDGALARMGMTAPGLVVIAPERPPAAPAPPFAWWQLDPSTGEAVSVLETGLHGAQTLPEYGETNAVSSMAYEVPPPTPTPPPISPMAYNVARPWAQCVEFSAEMLLELVRALGAVGG